MKTLRDYALLTALNLVILGIGALVVMGFGQVLLGAHRFGIYRAVLHSGWTYFVLFNLFLCWLAIRTEKRKAG